MIIQTVYCLLKIHKFLHNYWSLINNKILPITRLYVLIILSPDILYSSLTYWYN